MENTLTYSELQDLCSAKKITIAYLVKQINITRQGLMSALERQSLGVKYVIGICKILNITPNQFFRITDHSVSVGTINSQTGVVNVQQMQSSIDTLSQQLTKKDEQIATLLELLKAR